MEEERSNKIIFDGLSKLANKLNPNPNSELEIEWRIVIEQNGGVEQCLNVAKLCKLFLSNALLNMTSVYL